MENTQNQETTFAPQPIVQEQDFPKPKGRLAQLMSNYRREHHMAKPMDGGADGQLANVRVTNELKTRSFDELALEQQQRVLARIEGINYKVSADIQTFGTAKESPMTKQADVIISKYTANDVAEISGPLTDLVATLKTNNPKEIVEKVSVDPDRKEGGIFSSIRDFFAMKDAKKKMVKALAEHSTIMNNIQSVLTALKKQQLSLRKDINVYEQMGQGTYSQIEEFEFDCIALNLMIEDATEKLNALTAKGTMDLMDLNEHDQLQKAIGRMQRRLYTIQTIRTSTIQNLPQLAVLIYGNEIICEKIDEVETLVIPMWKWQYAIAAGAVRQQEALSIQKTIRGITSKLLTGNAKMLHDNMIAAQEELHAAAVAIEDLVTVQGYIDDMVTKVNEVRKDASKKYVEGMKAMQEIERKNYALLTSGDNVVTPTIES